jgi:hypothetical protein
VKSSTTPKRRRGAPLGNQNACRHGHYASQKPHLAYSEAKPLNIDLQTKIDLIHQSMRRIQDLGEPETYCHAVDCQRALTLAAIA